MSEPAERPGLLGAAQLRALAQRLGVSPAKRLGQNFVIDANTVRRIVRLAGIGAHDRVLEIGPGLGSLTLGLTEVGADVTAVEIDRRLAAELPATVREFQPEAVSSGRFRVLGVDALKLTEAQFSELPTQPEILVANLPYNVAVPIIMHLLEIHRSLSSGLVMVQAEVGHRLASPSGSREYGAPSVKAAWYGSWRIAGTVSRSVFWPVPNVDSVLVAFSRRERPLGDERERRRTFALVNAAFAQRRKMLRQALQQELGGPEETAAAIAASGVDPSARAEQLGVADYLAIARERPGDVR